MTARIEPLTKNEIRLTGTPIHCSACFSQEPKLRHVNFDADADRGFGPPAPELGYKFGVPMDDLILCENCVKEGARLVGMVDEAESAAEINRLRLELATQSERREHYQTLSKSLEELQGLRTKRSPESIAKQKATLAAKKAA